MEKRIRRRVGTIVLGVVGVLGLALEQSSSSAAPADHGSGHGGPVVKIGGPLPLPIKGSVTVTGNVSVNNLPAVQDVQVVNSSLGVTLLRTPVHAGEFFNITQPNAPPFEPAFT